MTGNHSFAQLSFYSINLAWGAPAAPDLPASSGRAGGRCWLEEKPGGVERMVPTMVRGPYHGAAALAAGSVRRLAAARDALQVIVKVKMAERSVVRSTSSTNLRHAQGIPILVSGDRQ